MKNKAKKLLCMVLVLMMAIPFAAFPAGAADEVTPLYQVNFNGDSNMSKLTEGWDGDFKITPSTDGSSVTLKVGSGSKWSNASAQLKGLNIQNGAYTLVFTVTASDDNEEIGLLLDHQTGFVVNPGQNTFRYTDHLNAATPIATTKYDGTGSTTQTYAIELAGEGTGSTNGQPNVTITTYKLYNLTTDANGKQVWNLACSLEDRLDGFFFDWGYAGDCDANIYCRFSRDRKNYSSANDGTITVKDFLVYEDLVVADLITEDRAYYIANDGDLLYTVNFSGDSVYQGIGDGWASMATKSVSNGGKSLTLKPKQNSANEAAVFGGYMDTTDYPAQGNSYTMVFTVEASDADQELGLYPDWSSGFVVAPGKNMFKYIKTEKDSAGKRTVNKVVVDYTEYNGTGALTQTYAIEYQLNDDFSAAEYNLYVAQAGKWVLLYSLNEDELEAGPNWSTTDYETVIRFYRDSKTYNQTAGTVTVSNMNVYKGLAAKSGDAAIAWSYDDVADGDLIYKANFKGDKIWSVGSSWAGMTTKVNDDGSSIALTAKKDDSGSTYRGNAWGKNIDLDKYPVGGNSYTVVFTVEASDADEEIGFYPDWSTGFVLTPGKNSFRYLATENEGKSNTIVVDSTTYEGTAALKQTYAVDFTVDEDYKATDYNLYVFQDGVWVCIYSLSEAEMANTSWGGSAKDYEVALRFYRHYYVIDESGKSTSTVDETQNGTVTVSNLNVYKGSDIFADLGTVTGASVRLKQPTGIRFTGSVEKSYFDALKAEYGAENVQIGMLITPRDYLVDNGLAFTKEALDACDAITGAKYLEIDAMTVLDEGTHYKVNCAMVDVREYNYNRSFSARLYIKVNGEIYAYAGYSAKNNSRSIADVAKAAYNDVKATADGVYKYASTLSIGTTVYSPYQNRDLLKNFFEEEGATSITVMSYNIKTYDDADSIWDKVTGDYEGWAGREVSYALETITELMPDVVGLQEDDQNLYNEYKNVPALEENYERLNANGNGNEGLEILYKKGMFTLIDTGVVSYKTLAESYTDDENVTNADFSLDNKGTNEVGRFFRWAILEKDGVQFLVVNTHLHYKGEGTSAASDAKNKDLRKAQATLIRRWLDESEEASGCVNRIVMGDMNAQGDAQEMKYGYLNGSGALNHAKEDALYKGDLGGTLIEEGFSARQPWVYDHILYNAEALTAYEFSVVDNYDAAPAPTSYPSDHLPVIAKFICK